MPKRRPSKQVDQIHAERMAKLGAIRFLKDAGQTTPEMEMENFLRIFHPKMGKKARAALAKATP